MFHWDGFSFAKTSLKNCWIVDLSILNCGRANTFDPILVMFIPSSSEKIIKQVKPHVLTTFKNLSHDRLRKVVCRWIPSPVCISYRINCECMFDDLPFGLATLCAIVMVWTGDHLAQCKMGAVKSGGYSRCRCHYVTSRWCARLAIKVWWNTMTIENIGGIHFPCDV
jgi:hypothetical protein